MNQDLQSEKMIEMAEVTNIGQNVFGKHEKFKLWPRYSKFFFRRIKANRIAQGFIWNRDGVGELTRVNHVIHRIIG